MFDSDRFEQLDNTIPVESIICVEHKALDLLHRSLIRVPRTRLPMQPKLDAMRHSHVDQCPDTRFSRRVKTMHNMQRQRLDTRQRHLRETVRREACREPVVALRRVFVHARPDLDDGRDVEDHEHGKGHHRHGWALAIGEGGLDGLTVPVEGFQGGGPAVGEDGLVV